MKLNEKEDKQNKQKILELEQELSAFKNEKIVAKNVVRKSALFELSFLTILKSTSIRYLFTDKF